MKERVAIIEGVRTPFCRSGGVFKDLEADELGAFVVRELLAKTGINPSQIDELIFGNVIQPTNSANIARIIAIKGGLLDKTPAYTVNRNCASGMEAIISAVQKISLGEASAIIAGGAESMSNFPILFTKKMRDFLLSFSKAKTWQQKLKNLLGFRLSFLKPEMPEIFDPLCGLTMGETAELLTREFKISREEQDQFALSSQLRALKAIQEKRLSEEIVPIPMPPKFNQLQIIDNGPRENQTLEALSKLKPAFNPYTGSVTAGNSSQVTDGAAAVLLMKEDRAKELGLKPLGFLVESVSVGVQPSRMGIGPAFAIARILERTGLNLSDFDLIEINEAFAAQILAVKKALASEEFAKKELGREKVIGELNLDRTNVNGGAIALGHPLGASGTRLVLTLLKELKRRNQHLGLATLCVGGGQGQAVVLEVP